MPPLGHRPRYRYHSQRTNRHSAMVDENPYAPSSVSSKRDHMYFRHRCCPDCRFPVPWTRFWFRSWLWAKWNCSRCGVQLTFHRGRRIATVAAMFAVVICMLYFIDATGWDSDDLVSSTLRFVLGLSLVTSTLLIDGVAKTPLQLN